MLQATMGMPNAHRWKLRIEQIGNTHGAGGSCAMSTDSTDASVIHDPTAVPDASTDPPSDSMALTDEERGTFSRITTARDKAAREREAFRTKLGALVETRRQLKQQIDRMFSEGDEMRARATQIEAEFKAFMEKSARARGWEPSQGNWNLDQSTLVWIKSNGTRPQG